MAHPRAPQFVPDPGANPSDIEDEEEFEWSHDDTWCDREYQPVHRHQESAGMSYAFESKGEDIIADTIVAKESSPRVFIGCAYDDAQSITGTLGASSPATSPTANQTRPLTPSSLADNAPIHENVLGEDSPIDTVHPQRQLAESQGEDEDTRNMRMVSEALRQRLTSLRTGDMEGEQQVEAEDEQAEVKDTQDETEGQQMEISYDQEELDGRDPLQDEMSDSEGDEYHSGKLGETKGKQAETNDKQAEDEDALLGTTPRQPDKQSKPKKRKYDELEADDPRLPPFKKSWGSLWEFFTIKRKDFDSGSEFLSACEALRLKCNKHWNMKLAPKLTMVHLIRAMRSHNILLASVLRKAYMHGSLHLPGLCEIIAHDDRLSDWHQTDHKSMMVGHLTWGQWMDLYLEGSRDGDDNDDHDDDHDDDHYDDDPGGDDGGIRFDARRFADEQLGDMSSEQYEEYGFEEDSNEDGAYRNIYIE
ncbi:hypothetical protein F4778DRAFT_783868 [Xylariomycetidae sp. FL2044]|nr:hypothetical protein F4778DRAFT_783868 [Xylariomycetidae sp. FL2044]